ncbi:MAG: DnaA N-terminal domain-containing protein, partial [Opitutae bacterium]
MSSQVSHLSLWETVKNELRTLFSAADYDTWIGSLNAVSIKDGNTLVLEAPTVLTEAWVNSNYTDVIRRQLTLVAGRNMDFQLSASASSQSKEKFTEVAP